MILMRQKENNGGDEFAIEIPPTLSATRIQPANENRNTSTTTTTKNHPQNHQKTGEGSKQELSANEVLLGATGDHLSSISGPQAPFLDNVSPKEWHSVTMTIRHWLSKDASFLERTLQKLNIKIRGQDSSLQLVVNQYRNLYFDSLSSFDVDRHSGKAVKTLVGVGFGDLRWAKGYRKFRKVQKSNQFLTNKIPKQEARVTMLQAQYSAAEKQWMRVVQQMELEVEEHQKESEEEARQQNEYSSIKETIEHESVTSRVIGFVSSMFSGPISEKEVKQPAPVSSTTSSHAILKRKARMKRRVKLKEEKKNKLRKDLQRAQEKLARFKTVQESNRESIPLDEYERASAIVEQVREDLCQALADHMQKQYGDMIERFQILDSKTGEMLFSCTELLSNLRLLSNNRVHVPVDFLDLTKPHEWFPDARALKRKVRNCRYKL